MAYTGNNHAVVQLQMELLSTFYKVVHRPSHMLQGADYFLRLGEDTSIDPLMKHYLDFAKQMYSKNTLHKGAINQDNLP
eukprot:10417921-Ditylum_brightwellii.AAC.1